MQELIAPFINTFVFQTVWNILIQLTSDTVGRIFLVTVAAYFVAYSIYGGYLTRFTGGISGFSLSRLGLGITDIVTLFPTALFTIIDIMLRSTRELLTIILQALVYFASPVLLGVFLGILIEQFIVPPQFIIQAGVLIYIFSLYGGVFILFLRKRVLYYVIWILQLVGVILIVTSPDPVQTPEILDSINTFPGSIVTALLYEISIILGFIIILLVPTLIGRFTAKFALSEERLSNVESITLRQPLNSLGDYQPITSQLGTAPISWKDKWFTKSIVPITMTPDVYCYTFQHDKPMYFIAAFNDVTVFFLADERKEFKNGQAILISRDLIHSLEFRPLTD